MFVEVPEAGRTVTPGEPFAVVESVKAASDVYAPLSGEVTEGNGALAGAPETLNTDPYGAGWLARLRPSGALPALLSAAEYEKLTAEESD